MKRVGLLDDAFLRLESRRTPLHIGVLLLFEPTRRSARGKGSRPKSAARPKAAGTAAKTRRTAAGRRKPTR